MEPILDIIDINPGEIRSREHDWSDNVVTGTAIAGTVAPRHRSGRLPHCSAAPSAAGADFAFGSRTRAAAFLAATLPIAAFARSRR